MNVACHIIVIFVCVSVSFCAVFLRGGERKRKGEWDWTDRTFQMEQTDNQVKMDKAMKDMMDYWNHLKQLHQSPYRVDGPFKMLGFTWSDCSAAGSSLHVSKLSVGPNPIRIPGNVSLTVQASLSKAIAAPLEVDVEVYKQVLIWVKVPCIDNVGSCTYSDVCALDPYNQKPCPPVFSQQKLPCKCPAKQGNFDVSDLTLFVNPPGVPSWLEDGNYRVTANLKHQGNPVGCLHMEFSITK